ncbi:hypothetical protein ArsFIN_14270 [Arsenophonus nasoniae]|uniref:Uncharacterized protein n=1 Tax=Arsenophonus nasoniae TaxID=638 RepID=A0A4P7KT22_9GAMM|nr:hypothetical protein ArsFIN_14270 [Arsenophonus nasoniae]
MLTKEIFVDIHVRFAQGQSLRKLPVSWVYPVTP